MNGGEPDGPGPAARSEDGRGVAVLVPCLDEAAGVARVVRQFRSALPAATVYVYDNGSSDDTAERARVAGARVRHEPLRGKGNVVRRMFGDVEAEIYLLVDGDDTYDAPSAPLLVRRLREEQLDMVNAARRGDPAAFRPGHRLGNRLLTGLVSLIFGDRLDDVLSGYRVLSRRFVKSFPAAARSFGVETELSVHALELDMPLAEVPTPYRARADGSRSKLRTGRDGLRILGTLAALVKDERPLPLAVGSFVVLAAGAVVLAWPLVPTWLETGLVPRFPTAILATGMVLLAFLCLACGLILDSVRQGRREIKRMAYLALPGPVPRQTVRQRSEPQRSEAQRSEAQRSEPQRPPDPARER